METHLNQALVQAIDAATEIGYANDESGPARAGLAQICLTVHPGETVALLGAPGAGVTALLRLLAGLDQPAAGQVTRPDGAEARYLSLAQAAPSDLPALLQAARGARLLLLDHLPPGGLPALAPLSPARPPELPSALVFAAARVADCALDRSGSPITRVLVLRQGRLVFDAPAAALAPDLPCFSILVRGRLDADRAAWFSGLAVLPLEDGTLLTGPIPDQPALFGHLARIRDLGLELESVNPIQGGAAEMLKEVIGL